MNCQNCRSAVEFYLCSIGFTDPTSMVSNTFFRMGIYCRFNGSYRYFPFSKLLNETSLNKSVSVPPTISVSVSNLYTQTVFYWDPQIPDKFFHLSLRNTKCRTNKIVHIFVLHHVDDVYGPPFHRYFSGSPPHICKLGSLKCSTLTVLDKHSSFVFWPELSVFSISSTN